MRDATPKMEKILVIGAGGLTKGILEIIERTAEWEVVGLVAAEPAAGERHFGYPVLGGDDQLSGLVERHDIYGAVVTIGDNWKRAAVVRAVSAALPGLRFPAVVHPSAQLARGATVAPGAVVGPVVVLDGDVRIEAFAFALAGAVVGHDTVVGEFASLGPGAVVCGGARIGAHTAIGVGANVLHGVGVGAHAVIGAGSTVTRDIPAYTVAYGSPANVVRQRQQGEPYL